jgi:hypothetical protein
VPSWIGVVVGQQLGSAATAGGWIDGDVVSGRCGAEERRHTEEVRWQRVMGKSTGCDVIFDGGAVDRCGGDSWWCREKFRAELGGCLCELLLC